MTSGPAEEPKQQAAAGDATSKEESKLSGTGAVSDELNAASDRIRETAKWLVATFGVVAGALIVGLQLSDIGKLEGSDRVVAAIAAFVALAAVILIVALASVVLARGRVPLAELSSRGRKYKRLRQTLNRNRSLYANYGSVESLVDQVEEQWDKQLRSWDEKINARTEADRAKAQREFQETKRTMPELNMLTRRLMTYARAEDIRLTFEMVRNWIIALAVSVALGAAAFAFVDNAPDGEEEPALSQRPVAARLNLDGAGQEKMGNILGPDCKLGRVPVEVLSSSDENWEVVSIPAEGCKSARLTVEAEDGELEPLEAVSLEPPEAEDESLEPPEAG